MTSITAAERVFLARRSRYQKETRTAHYEQQLQGLIIVNSVRESPTSPLHKIHLW